jgi:hypothetical protein
VKNPDSIAFQQFFFFLCAFLAITLLVCIERFYMPSQAFFLSGSNNHVYHKQLKKQGIYRRMLLLKSLTEGSRGGKKKQHKHEFNKGSTKAHIAHSERKVHAIITFPSTGNC